MIFFIPGELISILTFPGVMIHEIAHRLFCDLFNVDVYQVCYFAPGNKTAGHVIHRKTESFFVSWCIGIAPLIINSLVCMLLAFPYGCANILGLECIALHGTFLTGVHLVIRWIGLSAGFNAFPSLQDIEGLSELTNGLGSKLVFFCTQLIVMLFNINYIGWMLRVGFTYALVCLLPIIILF